MENTKKVRDKLSKKYFKNIAEKYDQARVNDIREKVLLLKEFDILKNFFKKIKGDKVLDVACGTGIDFHCYGNRQIYGLDISKDMLKICKERNPKAILRVANSEKIPFKENTFDVVITSRFICHTPYYNKVIKEMVRVTKSRGSLIIDFPNKWSFSAITTIIRLKTGKLAHYNLFSIKDIKNIAKENNLKIEEIKTKVFFPPKIFPKFLYKPVKKINDLLSSLLPYFSTPMYVKFSKLS
jgi:ubiquinone/menaquinone biosynthesis C-methylase UbiE